MNSELENLVAELERVTADATKNFGNLSAEQINWKPGAESWSVGQCFEHLIKTNRLFFFDLDKIAAGERRNSFLENYSPLSGFFGNLMIKSLQKDEKKYKAPTQKIVPPSGVPAEIINQFAAHQDELIEKIKAAENDDWRKVKLTSPFMKFMTYKLIDGVRIVIEHEKRHFRQAERVLKSEGFPKN